MASEPFFEGIFSPSKGAKEIDMFTQRAADLTSAFKAQSPRVGKTIRSQIMPFEQESLAAAQGVLPQYGDIQRGISMADLAAGRQSAVQDIGTLAQLSRALDPEFFANRAQVGQGASDFLAAGSGLTGGERTEIERSLAKSRTESGINAPTSTKTVEEASKFGEAARNRFANALNTAAAILPTLQTQLGQQPASGVLGSPVQTQINIPEIGNQAFAATLPALSSYGQLQQTALEGYLGEPAPAERAMGLMPQMDY